MAVASSSFIHVHVSPKDWNLHIEDIRLGYEEILATQENVVHSGSLDGFSSTNRAYLDDLGKLIEKHLKPIGDDFCEIMQKNKFVVERLGNMAIPRILQGEPVRLNGSRLDDSVVRLLRDLYVARPNENLLAKGLEKYVVDLGKQPRTQEVLDLVKLCKQYLHGKEDGAFREIRTALSAMRNQEYSDLPALGACYYLENCTLNFPCALLPPSVMYLAPSLQSAMDGDKNWGPLPETKAQYQQPPLLTREFLNKLANTNPKHLPPIVGSLPSRGHFDAFRIYIPDNYNVSYSIVNVSPNHKSIQSSLLPENVFIPAPAVQTANKYVPKNRTKKQQKNTLPTLDKFL
jgi:hypothetical protein